MQIKATFCGALAALLSLKENLTFFANSDFSPLKKNKQPKTLNLGLAYPIFPRTFLEQLRR